MPVTTATTDLSKNVIFGFTLPDCLHSRRWSVDVRLRVHSSDHSCPSSITVFPESTSTELSDYFFKHCGSGPQSLPSPGLGKLWHFCCVGKFRIRAVRNCNSLRNVVRVLLYFYLIPRLATNISSSSVVSCSRYIIYSICICTLSKLSLNEMLTVVLGCNCFDCIRYVHHPMISCVC